jgi:hypothetical protein
MRKLGTALAAGILLALATTAGAAATAPTVTVTEVDRTRVLAASPTTCSFDFVIHTEGFRQDIVFADGTHFIMVHFHVTYTNPVSGQSVSTPLAGPVIIEPNGDGTVTVTIDGNDGRFTDEGQGLVFATVGRLVSIADPADPFAPLQILQASGIQDTELFPAVCSALE